MERNKEQQLEEIKEISNELNLDYICRICQLPFQDPIQCEICQNIYCNTCIVEYVFHHKKCPTECKFINLVKLKRIELGDLQSIQIECNICQMTISALLYQQHLLQTHGYSFPQLDNTIEIRIPPARRMSLEQEKKYNEQMNNLKNIEESDHIEAKFALKCQICLMYLGEDSSECFNCENVWCNQCVRKYQRIKTQTCFNRCTPQNFILISQGFRKKYFGKYKVQCEECTDWLKVEDYRSHLNQFHSHQISQDKELAQKYFDQGKEATKKGEIEIAKQCFTAGLSHDYTFEHLWFQKALCLAWQGKYKESIINYREYLKIDSSPTVYYNIGINMNRLSLSQEQIDSYKKAIEVDNTYFKAYNNLGCTLHELGRLEEALDIFNQGIAQNDKYCYVHDSKASVLFDLKDYEAALNEYQYAIDLNPSYTIAYFGRSKCLFEFGKYQEALNDVLFFLNNGNNKDNQEGVTLLQKIKQKISDQVHSFIALLDASQINNDTIRN